MSQRATRQVQAYSERLRCLVALFRSGRRIMLALRSPFVERAHRSQATCTAVTVNEAAIAERISVEQGRLSGAIDYVEVARIYRYLPTCRTDVQRTAEMLRCVHCPLGSALLDLFKHDVGRPTDDQCTPLSLSTFLRCSFLDLSPLGELTLQLGLPFARGDPHRRLRRAAVVANERSVFREVLCHLAGSITVRAATETATAHEPC